MDEMTEKQEEATRIIEAIGTTTLNECYVPVMKSICEKCKSKPKYQNSNWCIECLASQGY
jgi:hypothetical protein